jgi:hypothetical protein
MSCESTFDTLRLHGYLDRFQTGDQDAADALLRATCGRLENLARKMLKGFPNVKRWADTDDVLQNALIGVGERLAPLAQGMEGKAHSVEAGYQVGMTVPEAFLGVQLLPHGQCLLE